MSPGSVNAMVRFLLQSRIELLLCLRTSLGALFDHSPISAFLFFFSVVSFGACSLQ